MTWGAIGSALVTAVVSAAISTAVQAIVTALTPPTKVEGPKLGDLKVQVSTYGNPVPIVYGVMRLAGNIIWSTPLIESSHEKKVGKGGGPKAVQTNYTYSQSLAIGLCEGEILGIRRIWCNGELIFNIDSVILDWTGYPDIMTVFANNLYLWRKVIYPGSETQDPSPLIQAYEGAANTPAYRGIAYITFENFELERWGNRTPNFEFEVIAKNAGTLDIVHRGTLTTTPVAEMETRLLARFYDDNGIYKYQLWLNGSMHQLKMYYHLYSGQLLLLKTINISTEATWIGPLKSDRNGCVLTYSDPDLPDNDTRIHFFGLDGSHYIYRLPSNGWFTATTTHCTIGGNYFVMLTSISTHDANNIYIWNVNSNGDMPIGSIILPRRDDYPTDNDRYFQSAQIFNNHLYAITNFAEISKGNGHSWISEYDLNSRSLVNSFELVTNYAIRFLSIDNDGTFYVTDGFYIWSAAPGVMTLWGELPAPNLVDLGFGISYEFVMRNGIACFTGKETSPNNYVSYFYSEGVTLVNTSLGDIVSDLCVKSGLQTSDIDVTQLTDIVNGYCINKQQSARASIEPLMRSYYFDAIESDARIKFVKRGHAVAAAIAEDDLAAHDWGSDMPDQLELNRVQEMELPQEVSVQYMDADTFYQVGTQYSRRLTGNSRNKVSFQVILSLTATKAKQITDVVLYNSWTERNQLKFSVSNKYAYLEPTDVVTIAKDEQTFTARLIEKDEASGIHTYSAVLEDSQVYTQAATPATLPPVNQTIKLPGPSLLKLLDIPLLRDQDDGIGFYAAACGFDSGWNGAVLYKSIDGGGAWSAFGDPFINASVIGYSLTVLPDFPGGNVFDENGTVDVILYDKSATLASITELAVLNGGNVALLGDEIIQFKNASLIAAQTYRLSGLLRGRRGTEWAMSMHAAEDQFIFFDVTNTLLETSGTSELGLARFYKIVTIGNFLEDAEAISFINSGRALECYAPVLLGGGQNSAGDITLNWTRRTRIGGDWNNYVDAQLGEASESYSILIYASDDHATLKRTLTSTAQTVTYAVADQITDFGAQQSSIFWKVAQNSAYVGAGTYAENLLILPVPNPKAIWRINISANNGDSSVVSLAELELKIAIGGSDQCTGGTPSASTQQATSEADKAFDNNNSTRWTTAAGQTSGWLQYDFSATTEVMQYTVRARADTLSRSPKDWTLEYKQGASWIIAHTVTGQTGWTSGELRTFTI